MNACHAIAIATAQITAPPARQDFRFNESGYRNGPANAEDRCMSKRNKSTELVEGERTEPGYPRPDESNLEDLPTEWSEEDVELENRAPNLGEMDEDPDEI
jgi:hypothetical protein